MRTSKSLSLIDDVNLLIHRWKSLHVYGCWNVCKNRNFYYMFYIHVISSFILIIYFIFMLHVLLYIYYIFICTLYVISFCYNFYFHIIWLQICVITFFHFIICTKLLMLFTRHSAGKIWSLICIQNHCLILQPPFQNLLTIWPDTCPSKHH